MLPFLLTTLVAQLDPGGMFAQGPAPDTLTQLIPGVGGFVTGGGITAGAVFTLVRSYTARIEVLEKTVADQRDELVRLKASTEATLTVTRAAIDQAVRMLEGGRR